MTTSNDTIKTMEDLGLKEQEARLYLASLKSGGRSAADLAKIAGIKRTHAYALLEALVEKNFVTTYFEDKKRIYYAVKPENLVNTFKRKVRTFEESIPLFEIDSALFHKKEGLRLIQTVDELKDFYEDNLIEYSKKKNKEYYIIGNAYAWGALEPDFFNEYRVRRAKLGIRTKLLLTSKKKEMNPSDKTLLRDYRYLPENYLFESSMNIFDDKILIVGPKIKAVAILIEVPEMVDLFKAIFQVLWNNKLSK